MTIAEEVAEVIRRNGHHEDVPVLIIHAAIRAIIDEEGRDAALNFLDDLADEIARDARGSVN
jgi:hypothetical protein